MIIRKNTTNVLFNTNDTKLHESVAAYVHLTKHLDGDEPHETIRQAS